MSEALPPSMPLVAAKMNPRVFGPFVISPDCWPKLFDTFDGRSHNVRDIIDEDTAKWLAISNPMESGSRTPAASIFHYLTTNTEPESAATKSAVAAVGVQAVLRHVTATA